MIVRVNLPRRTSRIFIFITIATNLILGASHLDSLAAFTPPCDNPGWFPGDFGLKDHHIFWHMGYYYLISNYLPYGGQPQPSEDRFAYARSEDLCNWEGLEPVLDIRSPGSWDEKAIWSPFVYQEEGVYYLYYTGVTNDYTQSILLATSSDPSSPANWEPQGLVFQPDHPGSAWLAGEWADCRDPTLLKVEDLYYLYYTARDQTGGIVGVATASSPLGPWDDLGSILSPISYGMPESPAVTHYGEWYYLFYNLSTVGEYYRIGASPTGPWSARLPFRPGWAHEIWQDANGDWLTSYLTDYTVSIDLITWDAFTAPPRPFVGLIQSHLTLPAIFKP